MLNNNLRKYVDDFFDSLVLYDDYHNGHNYKNILKASIDSFLDTEINYNAFFVYEIFLMIFQITPEDKSNSSVDGKITDNPNIPLDFVKVMFNYEKNSKHLTKVEKDNAIHSVEVFILGLAIYSQNKKYRGFFKEHVQNSRYRKYYMIDGEFSHEEFLYRWGLASLFHDIAEFIQITGSKPLRRILSDDLNSIFNIQGESINFNFLDLSELNSISQIDFSFVDQYNQVYPDTKFLNLFKPTDILAYKMFLDFDDLDIRKLNSIKDLLYRLFIVGDCPSEGPEIIDHGFVSAIAILDIYGYLIQKYMKNTEFFFYPVVDSATAILLHHTHLLFQKSPIELKQLQPQENPIAFLLILCDMLLESTINLNTFYKKFVYDDNEIKSLNNLYLFVDDNRLEVEYNMRSFIQSENSSRTKSKIDSFLCIDCLFDRIYITGYME